MKKMHSFNFQKVRRRFFSSFILTSFVFASGFEVFAEEVYTEVDSQIESSQVGDSSHTNIIRHEGSNREAVAINVAKEHFNNSNKVIIVNRDKFPDAISATNVSQGKYPVLYTRSDRIDHSTLDLLKSMPLDEVYILGGTTSVNEGVTNQIKQATGVAVTRIDGKDRFEVNSDAIQMQYSQNEHVVIASGEIYTDALYGVSYANTINSPVLIAKKDRLTETTIQLLRKLGVKKATLIGGPGTLTQSVETQLQKLGITVDRIAGANRYSGSAEVAKASYASPENVVVASGEVFSDALVSAPLAQKLDAPILLVRRDRLDSEINQYLIDKKPTIRNIYIHGGTNTITQFNQQMIEQAVKIWVGKISISISGEEDSYILPNESLQLSVQIEPKRAKQEVRWQANGGNIDQNGLFTASEHGGKIIIQAVSTDGSGVIGEFHVNILQPVTLSNYVGSSTSVEIPSTIYGGDAQSFNYKEFLIGDMRYGKLGSSSWYYMIGEETHGIVDTIGYSAFSGKVIESVTIPTTIKKLDTSAFYNNKLTEIKLPNNLQIIGYGAFQKNQLESIEIPDSVKIIDSNAFSSNNLTSVKLPDSLTEIKSFTFYNNQLSQIVFPSQLISIGSGAFQNNNFKTLILPEGVEIIGGESFKGNYIETVSLPKSLKSIGGGAFEENYIKDLVIPDNVTQISRRAFIQNGIVNLKIGNSVENIGELAFYGNKLTKVLLPTSLVNIGDLAFAFNNLRELKIPEGVESIGKEAFYSNTNLQQLILPSTLKVISEKAFNRGSLTEIIIPEGVTTIYPYAFQNNKLTKITIGSGVAIMSNMLGEHNYFRDAYEEHGAGVYVGSQNGSWKRIEEKTEVKTESLKENIISTSRVYQEDFTTETGDIGIEQSVTNKIKETVIENKTDYSSIQLEDDTMLVGESEVSQAGVAGYDSVIYEVTYTNSIETNRSEVSRTVVEPVNEIIAVGTKVIPIKEPRIALNGMTVVVNDISFTESEQYNTLTISYTETNNTLDRVNQNTFKLYLEDGTNHNQYGLFNTLMPGESTTRTFTVELLKTEVPQTLEFGDVFFNTKATEGNPVWDLGSLLGE